jgi:hypothetical protein
MIRVEYWEAIRLATIDDQVGYDWLSATGKRAVFSLLAGILLTVNENTARKNPSSLT